MIHSFIRRCPSRSWFLKLPNIVFFFFAFLQARAGMRHAPSGRGVPGLICHHLSVPVTAPPSSVPGAMH